MAIVKSSAPLEIIINQDELVALQHSPEFVNVDCYIEGMQRQPLDGEVGRLGPLVFRLKREQEWR